MHPEEPLVSLLSIALANGTPRIFVQELADHSLGDRMDDSRVCRHTISVVIELFDILARGNGHGDAGCAI
jgi:hypothetical protein